MLVWISDNLVSPGLDVSSLPGRCYVSGAEAFRLPWAGEITAAEPPDVAAWRKEQEQEHPDG